MDEKRNRAETRSPHKSILMDETITLAPATFNAYPVSIDLKKTPGCHAAGSFDASGGYGNDIEFLIFDEKNYREWEYRMGESHRGEPEDVPALYRSGRVASDTFDISVICSDTYYLVFNNSFSNFSEKVVKVNINLNYG